MQVRTHLLTKKEFEYLLAMPFESDEGFRIVSTILVSLEERKSFPRLYGKWYPLEWFTQQERILPEDEIMGAISRVSKGLQKPERVG